MKNLDNSCALTPMAMKLINSVFEGKAISKKLVEVFALIFKKDGVQKLSTRSIAQECDISIFAARNWLLKLEMHGLVKKENLNNNSFWSL